MEESSRISGEQGSAEEPVVTLLTLLPELVLKMFTATFWKTGLTVFNDAKKKPEQNHMFCLVILS